MKLKKVDINTIIPYENNPRNNDDAVEAVKASIEQCGYIAPIIVDEDMIVLAGHTRLKALSELGYKEVQIAQVGGLSEEQKKKYRLLDNKTSEFASWNIPMLEIQLEDLDFDGFDFGFDLDFETIKYGEHDNAGALSDKYITPPFSTINTRDGNWQKRKKQWLKIIHSGDGRADNLLGGGMLQLTQNAGMNSLNGTSVFDPVLAESLIAWFCPEGGTIIDPFAGGSVRGLVSAMTGREYVGIDLRQEQIDENEKNYEEIEGIKDFFGNTIRHPIWKCGDSQNIDTLANGKYDFMLTCPPYADLEKYSDNPADLSNMEYQDFLIAYKNIIKKTYDLLNDNAYSAIVVGEVRGKDGYYYNFVSDTISAFLDAGYKYYNEACLINMVGTGAIRANNVFGKGRKLVKLHQNVLIFVKGNPKEIVLGEYKYNMEDVISE